MREVALSPLTEKKICRLVRTMVFDSRIVCLLRQSQFPSEIMKFVLMRNKHSGEMSFGGKFFGSTLETCPQKEL